MVRSRAIIIQYGAVAMIERYRDLRRYFVFPGGGLENGETPDTAVIREVREELGVTIGIDRLVATVAYPDSLHYFYLATILSGTFGCGSGPETSIAVQAERGTYSPIWMATDLLRSQPVYPRAIAGAIQQAMRDGWPPLVVRMVDSYTE